MAGRAGRRGLDPTGTVIIVTNDSLPEQTTLHTMILGTPGKLSSQFRLTYNMILNLLRVEALRVEEMIKRSFSENASQRLLPEQQKKVIESEKQLTSLPKLQCDVCLPDIETQYDEILDITRKNQELYEMTIAHRQGSKIFLPGRVVILRDGHFRHNNIAVLLKAAPVPTLDSGILAKGRTYFVLAWVHPDTKSKKQDIEAPIVPPIWPISPTSLIVENGVYELTVVPLSSIAIVTAKTIKIQVNDIVDGHLISRMREAIASLEPIVGEWSSTGSILEVDWGHMRSFEFQEILKSRDSLIKRISNKQCIICPDYSDHFQVMHSQKVLRANIAYLKLAISDQNLELIPDYEQRVAVLRDLKFIDENSTVLLKGRVACEINSANELILTELILENALASYEPEEVVALLSCFVFQEKTDVEPVLSPKLEAGRDAILAISDRVGRIQDLHKVASEDFRSSLKFGLVEVVYEWAKGMPFEQITNLTDVAEGTIVRVITRLDETCREVRDAARVIGDAELFKKMEESQIKIKRDKSPTLSSRKRTREDESLDDSIWDLTDDGRPKTRRVNPQRLAIRLGPDLVAEMEALIVPGAKMPTFAIRKDFQERYAVDRRHIYDYFHSRGLRVAKEDKHTNLIRGRAMKAQAQAQAESQTILTARNKSRSPGTSSGLTSSAETSSDLGVATSSETDTEWETTSPCPQFTLPADSSDDSDNAGPFPDSLHSPDDLVSRYGDSPEFFQQPFLDAETTFCETSFESFMMADEDSLLTEGGRTELYDLINNSISRGRPLRDSSGSFHPFTGDGFRSSSSNRPPQSRQTRKVGMYAAGAILSSDVTSADYQDLRKWLSDEVDLYHPSLESHEYNPVPDGLEDGYDLLGLCSGTIAGGPGEFHYSENFASSEHKNRVLSVNPLNRPEYVGEMPKNTPSALVLDKRNIENVEPGGSENHLASLPTTKNA
ncbi:hypothetical protein NLJ89_g5085 [Agrocybe chaxingu]|uniref:ATP-dependent RNA helicase Ski2/MTR4 C-terminal domain-containing protein n=1 Tax=Agrocybe chaxingu TaxID=84603 RepID=A0A9W8MVC2_9AGAR|nr:hypothetical protein NLJ89_g5085 [Agrocybe chaxingu]